MTKLDNDIANVAKLLSDHNRASMLVALMAGKALTAGELALYANISAQTASNHLQKLIRAKLLRCTASGRHRYYRLTSNEVATAIESLGVLSSTTNPPLPQHKKLTPDICFARTCYDHLAGKLGVAISNALLEKNIITTNDREFNVTPYGKSFFATLNINVDLLQQQRRQFAKCCLDWTERNYHLAGNLGAALFNYLFENRFIIKAKHKPRIIILTTKGRTWLAKTLNLQTI